MRKWIHFSELETSGGEPAETEGGAGAAEAGVEGAAGGTDAGPAAAGAPRARRQGFGSESGANLELILDLPLEVTVRLGQTRILIRDLLQLDRNSVVELNQGADEPLDIVVNDQILARGEVVVIDERLGIRITDIIPRHERVDSLG